jgi:hypothetical protein
MLFALGAASSLPETLQSLTASKSSSTQSAGTGQTASNPFALTGPAVPSSTPALGTGSSNQISPQTMSALLDAQSQAGTTGATAPVSPSQALQNLFSDIDANGDGSISQQEFENALGAGGTNLAAADKVFGELDSNKDGAVTIDELKQALQGAGGHHHHMHAANGSSSSNDPDSTDPLLQALNASSNANSSSGSSSATTSSLTPVDPSQITPISLSTSTYNMIEQMMQRGAQAYATAPLSVSV